MLNRNLAQRVAADLQRKMVFLTGPRQAGKTTLARMLMQKFDRPEYLNWDISTDRATLLRQSWNPRADLLVFDEIHKMKDWKGFLKGVFDGRAAGQAILVTGSARLDTFRQSGESLAGRYFSHRLHPFSVAEMVAIGQWTADDAIERLLAQGGFPEPCLALEAADAVRWRSQYLTDLVREDVLDVSRIREVHSMRLLVDLLRARVGSPVSIASLGRDLQLAPATVRRYIEILEALYVIFLITPYHRNVARSVLKEPKIFFFDVGAVADDPSARFENLVACALLKHVHHRQDSLSEPASLHYTRTTDGSEVDFVVCLDGVPQQFIECKLAGDRLSRFLARMAESHPDAQAVQVVRDARRDEWRGRVEVRQAAPWLAGLT